MRVSVEIEDDLLEEVMSLTGEKGKSPALAKAVTEFVRRRKAAEFGRLIREGAFDYPFDARDEAIVNPIHPLPEDA
jgi:Arc/MetJ family transcription regulator